MALPQLCLHVHKQEVLKKKNFDLELIDYNANRDLEFPCAVLRAYNYRDLIIMHNSSFEARVRYYIYT